jgi:hypothetical protein
MPDYYEQVGSVSKDTRLSILRHCKDVEWKHNVDNTSGAETNYMTYFGDKERLQELTELCERWPAEKWVNALYLKLPKVTGLLHRHTDTDHPWETYHIVLKTNPRSMGYMYDPDGTEHQFQLKLGKVYHVNRLCEHRSVNEGTVDRIHLLMEVYA